MADEVYPPGTLHVKPESIPAVRRAIQQSLDELGNALVLLGRNGLLTKPWLNEPISHAAMEHYNQAVMQSETGLYRGLLAYEKQLQAAIVALDAAAKAYEQGEADQAALVLRMT